VGKHLYLFIALLLVLLAGAGAYAYTYTGSSATIGAVVGQGDIASVKQVTHQPGWDIVLAELEQEKAQLRRLEKRLVALSQKENEPDGEGAGAASSAELEKAQLELEIQELQQALLEGEAPEGNLFTVNVNKDYDGALLVKVYLTNAGALAKAYRYLDMRLMLQDSKSGTRVLNLDNGAAAFELNNCPGSSHTLFLAGGSYILVSSEPAQWRDGWSVTPELYCEVTQR